MKKFLSSLMAVLFTTSIALAQPPEQPADREGMPQPPAKMQKQEKKAKKSFEEIAKDLNLTDEQKTKIEELAKTDKEKKKEIRKQIREKSKAIDEELAKESYNNSTINSLTSEIQNLQGQIAKINIDGKVQMRSILTYDQFKQLEEKRKERQPKVKKDKKDSSVAVSSGTVKAAAKDAKKTAQKAGAKAQNDAKKAVSKVSKTKK